MKIKNVKMAEEETLCHLFALVKIHRNTLHWQVTMKVTLESLYQLGLIETPLYRTLAAEIADHSIWNKEKKVDWTIRSPTTEHKSINEAKAEDTKPAVTPSTSLTEEKEFRHRPQLRGIMNELPAPEPKAKRRPNKFSNVKSQPVKNVRPRGISVTEDT